MCITHVQGVFYTGVLHLVHVRIGISWFFYLHDLSHCIQSAAAEGGDGEVQELLHAQRPHHEELEPRHGSIGGRDRNYVIITDDNRSLSAHLLNGTMEACTLRPFN